MEVICMSVELSGIAEVLVAELTVGQPLQAVPLLQDDGIVVHVRS